MRPKRILFSSEQFFSFFIVFYRESRQRDVRVVCLRCILCVSVRRSMLFFKIIFLYGKTLDNFVVVCVTQRVVLNTVNCILCKRPKMSCEILHATSFSRDANEKVYWPGGLSLRIGYQHRVITDTNHKTIRQSRVHGERSIRISFSLCLLVFTIYTYIESFPVPKKLFDSRRCCCSYTLASIIITFLVLLLLFYSFYVFFFFGLYD